MISLVYRSRRYLLILGSALVLSAVLSRSLLYQAIDRWIEDTVQGFTAQSVRFDDILVIDIDEQAMSNLKGSLGAWPYPRDIYAQIIDYLQARGARAIIFDILFAEPRAGDEALGRAVSRSSGVWLAGRGLDQALHSDSEFYQRLDEQSWAAGAGASAYKWQDILLPATPIMDAAEGRAGVGVISIAPDVDGVLRHFPLLHEVDGRILPSMPLAALFKPGRRPVIRGSAADGWMTADAWRWPVDAGGRVHLRVPRNTDSLPVIGFDQVLLAAAGNPQAALAEDRIRGRTVFIGSSAAVLGDYAYLPIHGRIAGLGVLVLLYAGLAHGLVLKPPALGLDLLLILLAAALPLFYSNRRACSEPMIGFWALPGRKKLNWKLKLPIRTTVGLDRCLTSEADTL